MNFINLAKKRYSVRNYQSTSVETKKLDIILEAGRIAPTAANQQPNHFFVANTPESLKKIAAAANIHDAPLAILVCGKPGDAWIRPFDKHSMLDIDASIATDHMMLCAEDLGLSSCWLTYFDPEILCRELDIPPTFIPINLLVIGYAAHHVVHPEDRHSKTRKALSHMTTYNLF